MASQALCFYCFEVLAGAFQGVDPPRLAAVQTLFDLYEAEKKESVAALASAAPEGLQVDVDKDKDKDKWKITISTWRRTATPEKPVKKTPDDNDRWTTSDPLSSRLRENAKLKYPLFVTWNMLRDGDKILRGCIGTFEDQDLELGLNSYAIQSAFHDPRFKPIPANIVPTLSCSITLLADFETCPGPFDWEIGTHGIRISFTHGNRRYGATYLPDVAAEQGWTKEETLKSLMAKAGYSEYPRARTVRAQSILSAAPWEEVSDFKVIRYKGLKASANYTEWLRFREWASLDDSRLRVLAEEH